MATDSIAPGISAALNQISGNIQHQWISYKEVISLCQSKTCGTQQSQMNSYANNFISVRGLMEKLSKIASRNWNLLQSTILRFITVYLKPIILSLVTMNSKYKDLIHSAWISRCIWDQSGIMSRILSKKRLPLQKSCNHKRSSRSKNQKFKMLGNRSNSN